MRIGYAIFRNLKNLLQLKRIILHFIVVAQVVQKNLCRYLIPQLYCKYQMKLLLRDYQAAQKVSLVMNKRLETGC